MDKDIVKVNNPLLQGFDIGTLATELTDNQAEDKNVPYDRFAEVNTAKNDALNQIGKLQAQIDKMNQTTKDKEQAKLVEDGKLKEKSND